MMGKKIDWMRINPLVSVQVDEHATTRGWKSVIVDGRYEEHSDRTGDKAQLDHAWSLLNKHADWWEPGALKPIVSSDAEHIPHVFFSIFVMEVSGREALES